MHAAYVRGNPNPNPNPDPNPNPNPHPNLNPKQVHAAYVREVRRIFDTYKARFGYAEAETLELVSAKSTKAA